MLKMEIQRSLISYMCYLMTVHFMYVIAFLSLENCNILNFKSSVKSSELFIVILIIYMSYSK